jgi:methionine synthase II (cobalamin-independent)
LESEKTIMEQSTNRILTTHAGSLPRPDDLARMMYDVLDKKPIDQAAIDARVRTAVAEVVERQQKIGLDVISDGEFGKPIRSSIRSLSRNVWKRFANIVGKERVIAGTDCGFGTFVGHHTCHPEAAWLKLQALVEGAQLANQAPLVINTQCLWGAGISLGLPLVTVTI